MKRTLTYFVKLDDIWMANLFQDVNLARHSLYIRFIFDFVLFQDFNCDKFIRDCMRPDSHFSKGSLTE